MKDRTIEVAIADDHALMLEGLAKIISVRAEFRVGIKARNGKELLARLKTTDTLPDVLLLDINMPVMNGYETMKAMKETYPSVKVLAISMYESDFSIIQMFSLGAGGYFEKGDDSEQLFQALLKVYHEELYFPKELSRKVMDRIQTGKPITGITRREQEFISYCCTELTYKEIAEAMHIGERTVHGYRDALFEKLNIRSRQGLVIFAMSSGLVTRNDRASER